MDRRFINSVLIVVTKYLKISNLTQQCYFSSWIEEIWQRREGFDSKEMSNFRLVSLLRNQRSECLCSGHFFFSVKCHKYGTWLPKLIVSIPSLGIRSGSTFERLAWFVSQMILNQVASTMRLTTTSTIDLLGNPIFIQQISSLSPIISYAK